MRATVINLFGGPNVGKSTYAAHLYAQMKIRGLSVALVNEVANLPYSISNPFLFKLIENKEKMAWATIMLQKEVADRIIQHHALTIPRRSQIRA